MPARNLSIVQLLDSGFVEIDCWSANDDYLIVPKNLPGQRGVYAFAIDDQVRYVGLASRSIKQRLAHYARPGPSQTTNIRLNLMMRELIGAGLTVRVFLAYPEDSIWRGMRISGPEGLEAALIEDFDLPWNKRGASMPATPVATCVHCWACRCTGCSCDRTHMARDDALLSVMLCPCWTRRR